MLVVEPRLIVNFINAKNMILEYQMNRYFYLVDSSFRQFLQCFFRIIIMHSVASYGTMKGSDHTHMNIDTILSRRMDHF